MRTTWHSLAWKEWHEHKWKLVSIVAILWGVISLALPFAERSDKYGMAGVVMFLCSFPLAVFVGLGVAANERSRRTLPFLQSLPAPMWQVAVIKLILGMLTVVLPLLITVTLMYCLGHGLTLLGVEVRAAPNQAQNQLAPLESGNWYFDTVMIGSLVAASLFIWSAATGVNRKDEISAGAVALSVIVGWSALVIFLSSQLEFLGASAAWLRVVLLSAPPGGVFADRELYNHRGYLPLHLITIAVVHLVLIAWYVSRFGKVANLEVRSPQVAACDAIRRDWLRPPHSSALSAITWKQFRESGPLVLVGLAGVVGTVVLFSMNDPRYVSRPDQLAELIAGVSAVVGLFVAVIVGIGVCLGDVGPGLNTFWRSRPINVDLWFWAKFGTGLLVLAALYGPLLAVVFALHPDPHRILIRPDRMVMPVAHIAVFAAAVMTTCLVRHAVYAAILSVAVVYLGTLAGLGLWFLAGLLHMVPLSPGRWWEPTDAQVAFGMMLSFVISTIVAWLATRYDWGRKSRY